MALWHLSRAELVERLLNLDKKNLPVRMASLQKYAVKHTLTPGQAAEIRQFLETLPAGIGAPPFKVAA